MGCAQVESKGFIISLLSPDTTDGDKAVSRIGGLLSEDDQDFVITQMRTNLQVRKAARGRPARLSLCLFVYRMSIVPHRPLRAGCHSRWTTSRRRRRSAPSTRSSRRSGKPSTSTMLSGRALWKTYKDEQGSGGEDHDDDDDNHHHHHQESRSGVERTWTRGLPHFGGGGGGDVVDGVVVVLLCVCVCVCVLLCFALLLLFLYQEPDSALHLVVDTWLVS